MNCEYCGRFLRDDTCRGCGAPSPYQHHGDEIRLRAGIEPNHYGNFSTASFSSDAYLNSSSFLMTSTFRRNFSTTQF